MPNLLSLLHTIHQLSEQLLDCLQQEKIALDENQYEALSSIAEQKQQLLDQLEPLDTERVALSADTPFNEYIASCGDQSLIRAWNHTREIIAKCQLQNETNGRLLNRQGQIHRDIIALLSGNRTQTEQTYDAHGSQGKSASLLNNIKA